jgi:predicted RNase H-like HicB family nuclease
MPYLINRDAVTHGATYEEAARNGREVLEMLIAEYQDTGKPLPDPQPMTL